MHYWISQAIVCSIGCHSTEAPIPALHTNCLLPHQSCGHSNAGIVTHVHCPRPRAILTFITQSKYQSAENLPQKKGDKPINTTKTRQWGATSKYWFWFEIVKRAHTFVIIITTKFFSSILYSSTFLESSRIFPDQTKETIRRNLTEARFCCVCCITV